MRTSPKPEYLSPKQARIVQNPPARFRHLNLLLVSDFGFCTSCVALLILATAMVTHAGEYICTSPCPVYLMGGNRPVTEVKEGKTVHGKPDATGQWLIVTTKKNRYSMDLSHFISADVAQSQEQDKQRAIARLDERIQEIEQELEELERPVQQEQSANQRPQRPGETGMTNTAPRTVMIAIDSNELEIKLLEKELKRLQKKRARLANA